VIAPTREDLEKARAYADEQLRLGDEAAGQAEKYSCWVQAAQAYRNVGRIMTALAAAAEPPAPPGGLPFNLPPAAARSFLG
jgi:hypothetical protein